MSLFGLVLAIGLVVDDAIVVVEAVEHHIELGMLPREATLQAMKEVSGPVVGIALVLSAVFLPVGLMGGIQGRLNRQFAVTIAVSVLISAFNALSLSPALSAMILRPRERMTGRVGRWFRGFNIVFARTTRGYVKFSHTLIRRAALALAVLGAFLLVDGAMGRSLPAALCMPWFRSVYCSSSVGLYRRAVRDPVEPGLQIAKVSDGIGEVRHHAVRDADVESRVVEVAEAAAGTEPAERAVVA